MDFLGNAFVAGTRRLCKSITVLSMTASLFYHNHSENFPILFIIFSGMDGQSRLTTWSSYDSYMP